jgi:N-acetylglucosaminyl-diphospho-decaprenol L-rhamnosyltransferase
MKHDQAIEHPLLSAIVLNYRSPQLTVKCVQALRAQTIADKIEILVVDNHSQDDSIGVLRNRLKGMANVQILENHANTGYGAGNHFAADRARGEYLLIINPDNMLLPDAAETLIRALQNDPTIGMVAPQLVHEDGTIRDSYRAFPRLLDVLAKRIRLLKKLFPKRVEHYLQAQSDPHASSDVDWVVGACFVIPSAFFRELGGFDPRFFLFFEDIDLCKRCWQKGKRVVFLPQAKAMDRKRRLSEGNMLSLFFSSVGRFHLLSGLKYFAKWGI